MRSGRPEPPLWLDTSFALPGMRKRGENQDRECPSSPHRPIRAHDSAWRSTRPWPSRVGRRRLKPRPNSRKHPKAVQLCGRNQREPTPPPRSGSHRFAEEVRPMRSKDQNEPDKRGRKLRLHKGCKARPRRATWRPPDGSLGHGANFLFEAPLRRAAMMLFRCKIPPCGDESLPAATGADPHRPERDEPLSPRLPA